MLALRSEERIWLEEFRQALVEERPGAVVRMLVYGSKARGDAHEDSDIDVLLVYGRIMNTVKQAARLLALVPALLLVVMGTFPAAAQTFHEAMRAYVRGDYAVAIRGFRRAAERSDASAQFRLGRMFKKGQGVQRDYTEAVKWFRHAAEQGHVEAMFNLGVMYENGEGVPQDYPEATGWYRRAAERGLAEAQHNLGILYRTGEGTPQNYTEAAKWTRRAARQGLAEAQFSLGGMYRTGEGVPQDYAEATKWYRHAAEQGHAGAQNNLGVMYEHGQGVPQDLVQAHKWFNLSVSRAGGGGRDYFGYKDRADRSAQDIEKVRRNRDRVALRLTPSELAKAQHLALEWLPKEPQYDPAPEDIKIRIAKLQRDLRRLGYDPGPADGILGAKTKAAIRELQADHKLPITGEVSGSERMVIALGLVAADARATGEPPAPKPGSIRHGIEPESTGSGFRVSTQGHVLTNAHAVRDCTEVRIPPGTGAVRVAAREESSGLALLQVPSGTTPAVARFRQGRGILQGASVLVAGYPLRGLLASGANVSTGAVSALAGPGDDRRLIQITAPVQPGNSGGPVLDAAGNVVGVVVAKLDALRIAQSTGDIPQNVNFAVGAGAARAFLDAEGVPYETAPSDPASGPAEVAATARTFTVAVECWK